MVTAVDRINAVLRQSFDDEQDRQRAIAAARANEFNGLLSARDITRGRFTISILRARLIGGSVEIFARVYRDGVQLGFGADGSVDVERFVIVNPTVLVSDQTGDIVRSRLNLAGDTVEQRYRIDIAESLLMPLADMIQRTAKNGKNIVPGKEGRTTYTIFGDTADGHVESSNATYSTARSGSGLTTTGIFTVGLVIGQYDDSSKNYVWESFVGFDTSTVVGTISAATLSLYDSEDDSDTDFTINARLKDWGATLTTGDYIAGASLSGNTLLASISSASYVAGGYTDLTSQAAFASNINQSGFTRLVLCSSRTEGNNDPTGQEMVVFAEADSAGTTEDPKLVVVTADAGHPAARRMGGVRFAGDYRSGGAYRLWREAVEVIRPRRPSIIGI